MSTPKSPGGRSTPSVIGSADTTLIAPHSLTGGTSASRSSTAPRKFGCARKTADTSSPSASLQRVGVGDAVAQRDLLDLDAPAHAHRGQRLARMGMDPARDQEARALVVLAGEEAGGAERARALVERRVRDGQAGQLADRGLVLEHHLQRALGDLGLVGRVRRQGLRARRDRVHDRRHVVVVHPGAEERDLVVGGDVARGERAQVREHLLLRAPLRQVERAIEADALGERLEQLVDRGDADELEHLRAVGVGG